MTTLDAYFPGTRIYGERTFTRAADETDPLTGSTGIVTLYDPTDTAIATINATVVVAGDFASLTATYEHTLTDNSVPGVWTEDWDFANVLVVAEQHKFRVRHRIGVSV